MEYCECGSVGSKECIKAHSGCYRVRNSASWLLWSANEVLWVIFSALEYTVDDMECIRVQ